MTIADLLGMPLTVPQFQRPYDWEDRHVDDLIHDLQDAQGRGTPLFLGMVVLHDNGAGFGIIDGQQRLTTVMLALAAAGQAARVLPRIDGLTQPWVRPRQADTAFVRALLQGTPEAPATLSQWRLVEAMRRLAAAAPSVDTLLQCEVIAYVAPSLAGATRLFERINLRGKDVSRFDLVKNKLIDWVAREQGAARAAAEQLITERYDTLYRLLDPGAGDAAYDADHLLRVHWILFRDAAFKSGDQVLPKVDAWIQAELAAGQPLGALLESYLDSLVEVTSLWVWIERPHAVRRPEFGPAVQQALLDFARLGREGELQPLLVAALKRFRGQAAPLLRFCEINSLRAALARKNSNHGRALKWRLARQLYNGTLADAQGRAISTPAEVVHQLFWRNTPWWSKEEARAFGLPMSREEEASAGTIPLEALDSARFRSEYGGLIHYLFWNYGKDLLEHPEWRERTRVDISPFQEAVWFDARGFRSWDVEHIYPRNPDDADTREGREHRRAMEPFLNHLGNLTVLPIRDNRGMQNRPFTDKLDWLRGQQKVPFNELLAERAYTGNLMARPHWGPNNCTRRVEDLKAFATRAWGTAAIQALGVGPWDDRIPGWEADQDEDGVGEDAAD